MANKLNIAYLITAYNKQEQLAKLINCLGSKSGYENIFVHIDKKSSLDLKKLVADSSPSIHLYKKFKVYWGGYNQLRSTLLLMHEAVSKKKYDFIILLSGQDLPVIPFKKMTDFLIANKDRTFLHIQSLPDASLNYNNGLGRVQWYWFMDYVGRIRGVQILQTFIQRIFKTFNIVRPNANGLKLYAGSDWWMLPGEVAEYSVREFKNNKQIRKCFQYSFIPSEMYFHTVIANSPYKDTITGDNHRFIPWKPNHAHPEIITEKYKQEIEEGNYLFGRKFDYDKHPDICEHYIRKFTAE